MCRRREGMSKSQPYKNVIFVPRFVVSPCSKLNVGRCFPLFEVERWTLEVFFNPSPFVFLSLFVVKTSLSKA
jgi:hypothetical protein